MRCRSLVGSCFFALLLAFSSGSFGRSSRAVEGPAETVDQQIVRLTQEVAAAEVHSDSPAEEAKNIALLDKLSTDDSTHTHGHGRVQSKADYINDLKTGKSRIGAISLSDLKVRTYGSCAIINGQFQSQDLVHKETSQFLFTAFWVQQQGAWRMAAWVSTAILPNH
jgi:hypothetical protein